MSGNCWIEGGDRCVNNMHTRPEPTNWNLSGKNNKKK